MHDKDKQCESAFPQESTGRLLSNIKGQFSQRYDIFEYAKKFASDFDDILNSRWTSSRITTGDVYGDVVDLEFASIHSESFLWKIIVHSKKQSIQTSLVGMGLQVGEQYEVIAQNNTITTFNYRLNHQNAVMQKLPIYAAQDIDSLQGLIEHLTDTKDFYQQTSEIRGDMTRSHRAINMLENNLAQNFSNEKNIKSLKSHLFRAGFPVGSPDISHKKPLY